MLFNNLLHEEDCFLGCAGKMQTSYSVKSGGVVMLDECGGCGLLNTIGYGLDDVFFIINGHDELMLIVIAADMILQMILTYFDVYFNKIKEAKVELNEENETLKLETTSLNVQTEVGNKADTVDVQELN